MSSIFMRSNKKSIVPHSILAVAPVYYTLVVALMGFDASVLYDFFSAFNNTSAYAQFCAVAAVIVILDGGAIFLAHFLFNRFRREIIERIAIVSIIILGIAALVICGFLRLSDLSIYNDDSMETGNLFNVDGSQLMAETVEITPERKKLLMLTQVLCVKRKMIVQ